MDTCNSKQAPLRDSYVSCTEPVNPYHGNYVSVNLTRPWALNIPPTFVNMWELQNAYWNVSGILSVGTDFTNVPQWSDLSRNFIMPTHCVRYWSNGSSWWNPTYYDSSDLLPVARAARYPEAQIGDQMYLRATLLGQAYFESFDLAAQHSEYAYNDGTINGDFYKLVPGGLTMTNPLYGANSIPFPPEYYYLNYNMNAFDSSGTGLARIGGFNLTCFVVEAVISNLPVNCRSYDNASLSVTIKPLVPYADLSGCWLLPPTNYDTGYPEQEDWDGLYIIETLNGTNPNTNWGYYRTKTSILPAITANFSPQARCFYVTLPVQLYTARNSSFYDFTFTLSDFSNGAPLGPVIIYDPTPSFYGTNMVTVATKLRGVFLDANGDPTIASMADSIQFEIVDPRKVFNLSHTFEDKNGGLHNRPIFCTETGSIPVKKPGVNFSYSTSLLFSPRCGPGMWTNLPSPPDETPKNWLP